MARTCRLIVAALLLLGSFSPAAAQGFLYAVVQEDTGRTTALGGPTTLYEVQLQDGQFVAVAPVASVPGILDSRPEVTAGGQLVVWTVRPPGSVDPQAPASLVAFDRQTRAVQVIPTVTSLGQPDLSRLRLFVLMGGVIQSVTPSGITPVPNTTGLSVLKVSADGERLYARLIPGAGPLDRPLEVIASATGARIRSVPLPSDTRDVVITDDESSVYATVGAPGTYSLRKLDAVTGAEQGSLAVPLSPTTTSAISPSEFVVDEVRQRLVMTLVTCCSGTHQASPGELWTVDTSTMTEVARVVSAGPQTLRLDAHSGRVFLVSHLYTASLPFSCDSSHLEAVSVESGQVVTSLPTGSVACIPIALALPPAAPVLAGPVVSGASVMLSWTATGLTTGVVIEAGSATGLADIATLPVPSGTTLTVPNVASGTYFVRMRAQNYVGSSDVSNEVQVTVP